MFFNYLALVVLAVCSSTEGFLIIRQAEVGSTTGMPGVSGSTLSSTGVSGGSTGVSGISEGSTGSSGQPLVNELEQIAQNLAQSIESLRRLLNGQIQDLIVEQALRAQISVLEDNLTSVNQLLVSFGGTPVSVPTDPSVTKMSTVSGSSPVSSVSGSLPTVSPGFPIEV